MKRKIIKQGAGYTVTLPVDWIRKYNLEAGTEIDINNRGDALIINHDNSKNIEDAELTFDGNKNQIVNHLIAIYRKGVDNIKIHFNKSEIKDKEGITYKTSKIIQDTINELIGLSIVEQHHNYFLVKNIAETSKDNFDTILRRAFLLLLSISEQSKQAIQNKDKKCLEEIPYIFKNIRQMVNYALRLLSKYEYYDHKKTSKMYSVVNYIYEIADYLRHVAKYYSRPKIKITENIINLYHDLNELLRMMYELFYHFDESKMKKYFDFKNNMYQTYLDAIDSTKIDGMLENIGYIRVISTSLIRERMSM